MNVSSFLYPLPQVDFGDYQIRNPNKNCSTVHAFSMVLGFSRAMLYVEFVERCTLESFMDCHASAFRFLGGVPAEILYDNMKNVVIERKGSSIHFKRRVPSFCPPLWVHAQGLPTVQPMGEAR